MINHTITFIFILTLVLITGCSNGESESSEQNVNKSSKNSSFLGSCDAREKLGYCYEYRGKDWAEVKDLKDECDASIGGIYSDSPCPPNEDVVGTCGYNPGKEKSDKQIFYVFYKPMNKDSAAASCPGDFVPNY